MSEERKVVTVSIEHDHDLECPNEWGGWRLVSFLNRHRDSGEYFNYFTEAGPRSIGLRRQLQVGTAFRLDYYEHGNSVWSLMGEGPQCRWDTSRGAGLLLWEGKLSDLPKGYDERQASAEGFLETYTAWANGEGYYYRIEDEEGETVDACGGFYGNDVEHMFENIREHTKGCEVEVTGDGAWLADYHDVQESRKENNYAQG